jgi:hypothetical protein|tara:strand:- start:277 stop:1365 length:1089 start_codon:yes stop_codon:yes gene_type:complete
MSEQDLEVMEDAEVLETPEEISEDEDLLEFKADGEDSEVADPVGDKTDEKPKGKGDPMPKTKMAMINAMMKNLSSMKKVELQAMYKKVNAGMYEEAEADDKVIDEAEAPKELATITSADINIQDDVDAMLNGTDLDEEFKEKVATIFEAAVVSKVNEQIEKFAIEAESDVEVSRTEAVDELTEKVDSYLDYVVQEWVENNSLAIETGVRADMVEDFLKGLKGLFEEHYVDIPEEKVDVVEELIAKVDELEGKLNEETDKNVELLGKVNDFEKDAIFVEATDELTDTQIEKLRGLAEGIDFDDADDFRKKIGMLKSQYFDIDEETETVVVDDEDGPISLEEENEGPTGAMAVYMNAISRSAKK